MIEELKKNIDTEISILREVASYKNKLEVTNNNYEKRLLEDAIASLSANLATINNSIPALLNSISLATRLPSKSDATFLEKIKFSTPNADIEATIEKRERDKFFRELSISESLIKKIKKKNIIKEVKNEDYQAARGYVKLSNKFFFSSSQKILKSGGFRYLTLELKKANIDILPGAYMSMMFFSTLIAFFVGLIVGVFFLIFSVSLTSPFIQSNLSFGVTPIIRTLLIILLVPVITFISFYFYPSSEKGSIEKRIDQELPFAVIHMSAISGSGIAPSEIFRIIGLSKEYPFLNKEIRKILNQINLYGYDLVTALTNVSKTTPSTKLSELLSGLSTTINSGGSLQEFFQKRSETLLLDYRLEREKYTRVAETFMDIYISIVIAAPMILMVLLILISASRLPISFTPVQLTFLLILIISLINIVFLVILHNKQPTY